MDDWDWEFLNDSTPEQHHEQTVINQFDLDDDHHNNNSGVLQSDYFSVDSPPPHHNLLEDSGDPSWIDPNNISVAGGLGDRTRSNCSDPDSSEPTSDCSHNIEGDPSWIDPNNISFAGGLGGRTRSSCSDSDSSGPTSDCSHNIGGENETLISNLSGEFNDAINGEEVEEFEEKGEIDEGLHQLDDTGGGNDARAVSAAEEERGREVSSGSNAEKKKVVWWRVPLEVLKYCVLRVSPVWSLSMAAAAVMGFMILRRRYLYKMKRKAQGLQLKVTVDDKKVSQFTTRVARLNEAFSVVKRVPVIQASFTGPGLAPWPVMSMR